MRRAERLQLTCKLLDDGRLSDAQIADVVGRSKRWVRNIARQHPRYPEVEIIYAPPTKPNIIEAPVRAKRKSTSFRSRVRKVRKTLATAWEWLGIVIVLSLYTAGAVARARDKARAFNNRVALQ